MDLIGVLGAAIFYCSAVSATVASTGFTVSLGDVPYFLPPKVVATVKIPQDVNNLFGTGMFVPLTVVKSLGYGSIDLSGVAATYLEEDDVFQEGFLESMFASSEESEC